MVLNKLKRRQRVKNGKPSDLHDSSMDKRFAQQAHTEAGATDASTGGVVLGQNALLDLTDRENDEVRTSSVLSPKFLK
jgi:hypothetical protein